MNLHHRKLSLVVGSSKAGLFEISAAHTTRDLMKVMSVPFLISVGTSMAIELKLLLMDRLKDFSSRLDILFDQFNRFRYGPD